ncbi:MAG: amidohydrolase 2 [Phenylobacterium sp.]|uniref:amidohydrolase family protein n=1 Tax=Phenylobacterium sp. TaxID=1871053 RepID=UPI00261ACB08|nr:amidohydrolase family protein [Phenylobacterium sp.]MDB5497305.1 amidohydrolase 2 [Phenylobacterium sp.]
MDQLPIFDIDTHFAEPGDLWTSRAPAKYRDRVLHVRRKEDGKQAWFLGNMEVGMIGPSVVRADLGKELHTYTIPDFDQMAAASYSAPARLKFMDSQGVGTQIVYPNIIGFGAQKLMQVSDDVELRHWHVQAYNDALVDFQKDGQGRLLPQAALPLWDIEASLKELERIRKMGLTGVAMSDKPKDFGQVSLASPEWERFFATCQDLGLPINFHIGSGSFEGEKEKWWHPERSSILPDMTLNGPLATFTAINNFLQISVDIMNLILTGILEKFPKLNFVVVESGAGWIPFLIQALEHNWREMLTPGQRAKFKRGPKEMFIDQIYAAYWFEDSNCIDPFLKEFGNSNLMFETDFPHPTSLYPGVREQVVATLGHHSVETQRKVLYQNAERVYGVKVGQPATAN